MGVFGYGEIIANLSKPEDEREVFAAKVTGLMPTKEDFKHMIPAMLRGTALGSALGILPGGGAMLSAFAAYTIEKKPSSSRAKSPSVKATSAACALPSRPTTPVRRPPSSLLTLGIPPNAVMALMVGAMTIHNIQPGPQLLTVPYRWLFPSIVLFCAIGVYGTNNNTWDVWMVGIFGFVGYVFHKLGTEPAPLLLGFILGPMMEENLRRALLLSRGDWSVFVTRPISAGLLLAAVVLLVVVLMPAVKNKREEAFVED
ncbi:Membrane-associated phosphatidylinositol transfer protein 2 [Manis javanica]|nr:Membrane-associated phosphatidylinositol transfer protein 2 [Manis javanica]